MHGATIKVILSVVLHECAAWSFTLKEEYRQRVFEKEGVEGDIRV
jgi:hypothetical protein